MTTTIITTQPSAVVSPSQKAPAREWTTGLCSCFDDLPSCLLAFFCPNFMECWIAHTADECALLPMFYPGSTVAIRTKVRTEHNIRGTICNDCLLYACCPCCVMAQTKREMDYIRQGRA
ncbi:placenta-specific gene 8 protein-like [Apostichopus japonicus]|uniref:placenta-specific gene 8 protein-like n=1 Tax=Stichopus japonicus TaxID=307972 RepID=UPI003AB7EEEE